MRSRWGARSSELGGETNDGAVFSRTRLAENPAGCHFRRVTGRPPNGSDQQEGAAPRKAPPKPGDIPKLLQKGGRSGLTGGSRRAARLVAPPAADPVGAGLLARRDLPVGFTPAAAGRRGLRYGSWMPVPSRGTQFVYSIVPTSSTFPISRFYLELNCPAIHRPSPLRNSVRRHRRTLRGYLWPYGGWIGVHAAAPGSLLNDCHPQPVNARTLRYLALFGSRRTASSWSVIALSH